MHTWPLHLLTFKSTVFPRSQCDSGDCTCVFPAVGSLSLAFMLAQSLMWSNQIFITHIPSSALGYIERYIGLCASLRCKLYLLTNRCETEKVCWWIINDTYVCGLSASKMSDCNVIEKRFTHAFTCWDFRVVRRSGLVYGCWIQRGLRRRDLLR